MKSIFSPYRICPLGAHVDHQGGAVLGRTIALGTTLEYEPLDSHEIHLTSAQFGEAKFLISAEIDKSHWARYAQAAARVLPIERGLQAHVSGDLIGAGLSSSASVGLAYLTALADVNGIVLPDIQLVRKDFELENKQLGLQNGLLDPMSIVYGKKNTLLFMDTNTGSVSPIFDPNPSGFAWIVAYSGISRELTKSGFNIRVAECHEAAAALQSGAWNLGDVSRERFEEKKTSLPGNLRKRAEHYFSEVERVHNGAQAWAQSDLETFGQLMNRSCASSIQNYESGSPILIELHELVSGTRGVYGSRFSGGGYGGCVVVLAEREMADELCVEIQTQFKAMHPELAPRVFIAETADGLCMRTDRVGGEVSAQTAVVAPKPTIRSAVLLAAGRGKRQRPYTDFTPKPLLEVNGRTTLDYALSAVKKAGITRVCIVTHHLEEQIVAYVGADARWDLAVTFAHQPELNGTGGALQAVPATWIQNEPVMVVATDYILEENALRDLVDAHQHHDTKITMSLKECAIAELMARSSVDVDADWRVRHIIEKPGRAEIMSPYAASIMFILPPQIWEYLPRVAPSPRGEIEMQTAIQMMLVDGFTAHGVLQDAPQEWLAPTNGENT